jgi:AGCS family alanine or glycine:cation symporter
LLTGEWISAPLLIFKIRFFQGKTMNNDQFANFLSLQKLLIILFIGLILSLCCFQEEASAQGPGRASSSLGTAELPPDDELRRQGIVPPKPPKGWDKTIDEAFKPIANYWESVVLTPISLGGQKIPLVVVVLVLGAGFFTLYFSFINLRLLPFAIAVVMGKYSNSEKKTPDSGSSESPAVDTGELEDGEVSHFQALATAVSGTVGLGNISGVAVAIATGGPGATFWMIVCGLIGMSTKFVECTLGVKYRDVDATGIVYGGPMYYLKKGLAEIGQPKIGIGLGTFFAILCVGASFGGGNMFQSNQATKQIMTMFDLQGGSTGALLGIVIAVVVGIVIIGGIKRIASVTEKIVPFMAIIYVAAALVIILANIVHLPGALLSIVTEAFNAKALGGGFLGVLIIGFTRAAFSNEAGAGSAAIAHSAVKTKYPASEGVVALLEPFIDTVVICTMTALVIIIYNNGLFEYGDVVDKAVLIEGNRLGGVDLTSKAFDSVLPGFRYVLTVAIILFAFSTMISWSYYGLQSWKFLFGRSSASDLTFKLLFCLFIVIGAASSLDSVIAFSDAMILALVFPNMFGLMLLFPKVRDELKRYLAVTLYRDKK